MGLVMSPGSVISQLDSMNENLQQAALNAETMLLNVNNFLDTGDVLKGEAYDSIRGYFGTVHVPILNMMIQHAETLIQENNAYKNCISTYLAGIGYIDEDGLKQDKEFLERQISQAYGFMFISPPLALALIASLEQTKQLVEKKLQEIDAFKADTAGLYQGLNPIEMCKIESRALTRSEVTIEPLLIKDQLEKNNGEYDNGEFNEKEIEFINILCRVYGFDEETAQIMTKLYRNLETVYEDDAPQQFFALMASFEYGKEGKDAILWGIIANIIPIKIFGYDVFSQYGISEEEYEHIRRQLKVQHILCGELEDATAKDLKDNTALKNYLDEDMEFRYGVIPSELDTEIENQIYEGYLRYCNKPDFSHMCATTATILNDEKKKGLGSFAGLFNGIYLIEENAGYVGDVYGTNGAGPSMDNADYMADLDAVNIANLIKNDKNAMDAMSEYYTKLENGQINRAREFKCNIGNGNEEDGLLILIEQSRTFSEYTEEHPELKLEEDEKKIVARFIMSLVNNSNSFINFDKEGDGIN